MNADAIVARLVSPDRPAIFARTAVVLAHPDDETLGCGALLPRLADVTLVHVTDGAPRDEADARRHGFADAADYAAARRRELEAAAALAGIPPARLRSLGVPDQGAALVLADLARRLVPLLGEAELVLTHAYEGGHPDHDATAFAVHAAAALLAEQDRQPAIVEMPFYRAGPDGSWLRASFGPAPASVSGRLVLSEAERERKARMLLAHRTQRETLAAFPLEAELYRAAPRYDFLAPPNGGRVLYDGQAWGMRSARFCEGARLALHELGLPDAPA